MATLWLGTMGASAQTDNCDANGDGVVNINDAIYVIDHVLERGHAGDIKGQVGEAIDLGLPSGTMWASWNVGAAKPEGYGGYYSWGETVMKILYNESTYRYYQSDLGTYVNLGTDISGTEYDIAQVKWGGNWTMPNQDDMNELVANCTQEWTTLNGVNGTKFTSNINGNSIFMPATGYQGGDGAVSVGAYGLYWLSIPNAVYGQLAHHMTISSGNAYDNSDSRYYGISVRPVYKKDLHPKMVDLGLPSGTKWASCNVGASKPEESGKYYSWGETEDKDDYSWNTYFLSDGTQETCYDIGSDISGTEYDVAYVKWGGNWVMPSLDDIKELIDNCTSVWTTLHGVEGRMFTSKTNGNSIFLPATGCRADEGFSDVGDGAYWSSTLYPSESFNGSILDFDSNRVNCDGWGNRYLGICVRPVVKK